MRIVPLAAFVLLTLVAWPAGAAERFTGPWNVDELKKTPAAEWGEKQGLVQTVYYEGEPRDGKPTRVFAYFALPENTERRVPGMVLVHGGGGTAFREWAELWARRGYAALAMDLAGRDADKQPLPDGGPDQGHPEKFRPFANDDEARQLWSYYAVAAVIRGHSLLAARPEVDAARTGLTGISWGGYLTCIVAGLDDRFKVAVPVYGCGFLHENSCWLGEFEKLGPEGTARWVAMYDPSRYLPGAACRMLFVNGTNDFAYPLDSYRKSYRSVPGRSDVRIQVNMPHGHPQGWAPAEIGLYVDSVLANGVPLPRLGRLTKSAGRVSAAIEARSPVESGALHYTTDTGAWQKRGWKTVAADVADGVVSADLPEARPIVYYLSVTDRRGATMSTEHESE
jgi:hypothetical protein